MRGLRRVGVAAFLLLQSTVIFAGVSNCKKPYLYFDLGDTIVDTMTHSGKKFLYLSGAREYLNEARRQGFKLGLVINVPESWGANVHEKIEKLKDYIKDGWLESEPFIWEEFELGILVPENDAQRKPAPILFDKIVNDSARDERRAVFQGESPKEVQAAKLAGALGYLSREPGRLPYMDLSSFKDCAP